MFGSDFGFDFGIESQHGIELGYGCKLVPHPGVARGSEHGERRKLIRIRSGCSCATPEPAERKVAWVGRLQDPPVHTNMSNCPVAAALR